MSDERLDELAESARNRGLKLIRSRVRTPGKRRFGTVGLTDARGKAVFGLDDKGPVAKPEEVEAYLRNLGAKDWGASLGVGVMPRTKKAVPKTAEPQKTPPRRAANDRATAPRPPPAKPKRPPRPQPQFREAKPGDARRLTELIGELGHEIDEKSVRRNMAALSRNGDALLVATLDREIVGLCGLSQASFIHRARPVGRINLLIVAEKARRNGIGRMLVEAGEARLKRVGCGRVEIVVGDLRTGAQAFYRRMGYVRDSVRFLKPL